ncbi:MAG: alpha-ketoacid dehydrogenase subunit beta [Firmicutes bacterium]|nr:alpha-ketoacid dehydrogenase subunit beta [Bacillota bacterium]
MAMRELTMVQALNEALQEEMARDGKIFCLGEDVADPYGGAYQITKGLANRFGADRCRNTPISEAAIVGVAVGAAQTGLRPVAELMYMDFMGVCFDQILNQMAKLRFMLGGQVSLPMIVRGQQGSGRGNGAQHSQSLEAFFFHTPGLLVVQPSNPYDAKGLLKSCLRQDNPVIFLEHKMLYNVKGPVPDEEYVVPLGVADICREGSDVTVVATGLMVNRAKAAAARLAEEGISVELIDPRTLFPLDLESIVGSVMKTGRCIIVHEANKRGGVGAEIAAQIMERAFDYLDAPVERLAGLDIPMPYAPHLEKAAVPQEDDIVLAARRLVREGGLR